MKIALGFYYFFLVGGLFSNAFWGEVLARRDLMIIGYPFRWLAARIWASGEVPLWNSAAAGGMPLLGDPMAAAFDPFLALFALPVSVYRVGTFFIILKFWLAGIAMHRYLRTVGHTHSESLLGGSVFILSGFSIGSWTLVQWTSAMMFLPLALTVPHLRGSSFGRGIAAAAILGFSFFGGAVEPTAFAILLWGIENIRVRRPLREIVIGISAFLAITLLQSLPTWEMALHSERRGGLNIEETLGYSLSPLELIGLGAPITFVPDSGGPSVHGLFPFVNPLFFGTYIGAALLPLALLGGPKKLWVIPIAAIALGMGKYLPGLAGIAENAPWLGAFRYPIKVLWFLPPLMAILAASGYRSLENISPAHRRRACITGGLIVCGLITAGTVFSDSLLWAAHLNEIVAAVQHAVIAFLFAAALVGALPKNAKPILVAVILLDLFIAGRRAIYFEPAAIVETPVLRKIIADPWPRIFSDALIHFSDTAASGSRQIHELMIPNAGIPHNARHVEEYGSFRSRDFVRWSHEIQSSAAVSASGVKYILCDEPLFDRMTDFRLVARSGRLGIFENPSVLSEVRFYRGHDMPSLTDLFTPGKSINHHHELSGRTSMHVKDASGWVYRAESWYPGWKAWINGREVPVMRSEDFFGQLVFVDEPGEIVFAFRPPLFYIGLFGSLSACALIIGSYLLLLRSTSDPRNRVNPPRAS